MKIDVTFSLEIPEDQIQEIHEKLEELHQGTVDYCNVWDELRELHVYLTSRLEGESLAYMNIAREKLHDAVFRDKG